MAPKLKDGLFVEVHEELFIEHGLMLSQGNFDQRSLQQKLSNLFSESQHTTSLLCVFNLFKSFSLFSSKRFKILSCTFQHVFCWQSKFW